ncbi:hypothetical protein ETAA8_20010 [Anatilimnocola aggregata]|uniref:Uncharacterized protein n=1 Tax=Anatilimnocola aggregata TaxID=2528021 RepID=A0A517Y9K7_9BACT|nr:hypothetical protein [Anatilimnocola aggregata]QDU26917.1 hypothetical protein ETAA8_20010 [Anatilimnocola aggregata]
MQLTWKPGSLNSALHAAAAVAAGKTLVDPQLQAALAEPAEALKQEIAVVGLPEKAFRRALAGFATQFDAPRQLVERAVVKVQGNTPRGDLAVAKLTAVLTAVVQAFQKACPNPAETLRLRERPLREQWESRGAGMLRQISSLTDERLLVPEATIVLVHPALGGGGEALLQQNAITFEAVLTNPEPRLPEIVRMAWLLAQLNCDLPVFAEHVNLQRLPHVAAFALLPVALQAAAEVELGEFSPEQLQRAITTWHLPQLADLDASTLVYDWWLTYQTDKPAWPVALTALDQMFG